MKLLFIGYSLLLHHVSCHSSPFHHSGIAKRILQAMQEAKSTKYNSNELNNTIPSGRRTVPSYCYQFEMPRIVAPNVAFSCSYIVIRHYLIPSTTLRLSSSRRRWSNYRRTLLVLRRRISRSHILNLLTYVTILVNMLAALIARVPFFAFSFL